LRLEPRAGERIDRGKAVSFTFAGWKVTGFEGDTIASAAFAAGKRVFSRSFKYHRPRGLMCCSGHCPNCQMTVDGVPNVRVCTEPIREGAVVEGQTLDEAGVRRLATLPSRDVLQAQVVGVLAAPLQQLVTLLSAAPREFVVVLDQIIQKKQAEAA